MQINQLPTADQVYSSDLVPIYSSCNGYAKKTSFNTIWNTYLLPLIQALLPVSSSFITQLYTLSADSTIVINNNNSPSSNATLLIITSSAINLTIVFPPVASCVDGQIVQASINYGLTSQVLNGNGAALSQTAIASDKRWKFQFDALTNTWWRLM